MGAELRFAPVTVIAGRNSSGKSSLIQSILLLAQAARQNPNDTALALNGGLIALGGVEQVRSFTAPGREPIEIGAVFLFQDVGDRTGSVRLRAGLRVVWTLSLGEAPENRPGAATIRENVVRIEGYAGDVKLRVSRQPRPPGERRRWLEMGQAVAPGRGIASLEMVGDVQSKSSAITTPVEILGVEMSGGFPRSLLVVDDEVAVFAREWWQRNAYLPPRREEPSDESEFYEGEVDGDALDELVLMAAEELELLRNGARDDQRLAIAVANPDATELFQRDPDLIDRSAAFAARLRAVAGESQRVLVAADAPWARTLQEGGDELRDFLSHRVAYLGPLRQDPRVLTPGGVTSVGGDIGTRGELAASVLYAERDRVIECPELKGAPQRRRLGAALTQWAQHFELAEEVSAHDLGRLGIEMRIRPYGLDHDVDLTNVGVGVSQLLPVLLSCLLAEPGSLVLLEQPELHLHPAAQQLLGDFLLACARSGRQLIVETHSEHLIGRLRLHAAEDETDETVNLFKIVFSELEDGQTKATTVEANRYGGIDEWPRGFFDQGVAETRRILEVGLGKKQRESESHESEFRE
jgi:predicted ATPase